MAQAGGEKDREGRTAHLARGHRKRAMADLAETARMAVDRHIVGRVGEHHRRPLLAHQGLPGGEIECVAAQQPMRAQPPQIAGLADRRRDGRLDDRIGRVRHRRRRIERADPQIDLGHLEAGDFEAEIEAEQGEVLELLGQ